MSPRLSNRRPFPDVIPQATHRTTTRRSTVKYMLLLRYVEGEGPQEGTPEFAEEMQTWGKLNEELTAAGQIVFVAGLQPEPTATTVRTRDGERVLTDGPFAETKELLFSFYIVDVPDLDAAIALAARMPAAGYGSVEVRPLSVHEQNG
jgi:hypothetical protein